MKKMMIISMMLAMLSGLAACGMQDNTTTAKAETLLNTTTTAQTTSSTAAATTAFSAVMTTTAETTTLPAATAAQKETTAQSTTGKEETMESNKMICGGWSIVTDNAIAQNENAKNAFERATQRMVGASYEPLAVLGTQVVSGTNYCILCRLNAVTPDAQPAMELLYIYEDLSGNASIIGTKTIIGEAMMGGLTANKGETDLTKNADVQRVFDEAVKELTGISYEPAAYLGSQQVAGTNYLILCKAAPVVPNASAVWSLVKVGADLNGKASVLESEDITLGDMENID